VPACHLGGSGGLARDIVDADSTIIARVSEGEIA